MTSMAPPPTPSGIPKLPFIEHPMSHVAHHLEMCATGSQNGDVINGRHSTSNITGRCLPAEEMTPSEAWIMGSRQNRRRSLSVLGSTHSRPISRNMAISTPRLIGHQNGHITARAPEMDENSKLAHVMASRIELDQLEFRLREKVKGNFVEVKKRFMDNDPTHKGFVSREALLHILSALLDCPLSAAQLSRILHRIGIPPDRPRLSLDDFLSSLTPGASQGTKTPHWMDTVQRNSQEKLSLTADFVFTSLKEKLENGSLKLQEVFPVSVEDSQGMSLVRKLELKRALASLSFFMNDVEFDKLWARIGVPSEVSVAQKTALQRLGVNIGQLEEKKNASKKTKGSAEKSNASKSNKGSAKSVASVYSVTDYIKSKLRHGFSTLHAAFLEADPQSKGLVDAATFIKVVSANGLRLTMELLPEFLQKCRVTPRPKGGGIPYQDFLFRVQDRSPDGVTNRMLTTIDEGSEEKTVDNKKISDLMSQLLVMFQRDFLTLLSDLHKVDTNDKGVVSMDHFRKVLESRFQLTLTDDQFKELRDRLPLTTGGDVLYAQFLLQFDGQGLTPSLFDPKSDEKIVHPQQPSQPQSLMETIHTITNLLQTRLKEVVRAFEEIDQFNSNKISPEDMHKLLNKFNVQPEISLDSIHQLWNTFFLNDRQYLDLWEFLRHFVFDPRTSRFPNAKVEPPRLGDVDVIRPSQRLTGLNTHIAQTIRYHINFKLGSVRDAFLSLDPLGTGEVTKKQFKAVLLHLSPNLSNLELDTLCHKFDSNGKVSYAECLKPFALRRIGWRTSESMASVLSPRDTPKATRCTQPLSQGLLKKCSTCDLRALYRQLKKHDTSRSGTVSIGKLRELMTHQTSSPLTDDDLFEMMMRFDQDMGGRISYESLLVSLKHQGKKSITNGTEK